MWRLEVCDACPSVQIVLEMGGRVHTSCIRPALVGFNLHAPELVNTRHPRRYPSLFTFTLELAYTSIYTHLDCYPRRSLAEG